MPYLKMLWQTEQPTPTIQSRSWDFWSSKAIRTLLMENGSTQMFKYTPKIVYYALYESVLPDYSGYADKAWFTFLFMSPDLNAVCAIDNYQNAYYGNAKQFITDVNGIKWYYQASKSVLNYETFNPDYRLEVDCDSAGHVSSKHAAQTLLDRIYAVPFHEDYQPSGYNYITVPAGDIRKTVRKALGLHLAFNVQYYSTNSNYQALSDGVDGMIDDIVNNDRSVNGNIHIQINPYYATSPTSATRTLVRYMTDNRSLTARIGAKEIYNNLPHYQTTYSTSMNYYEREYRNATYRLYGSSAISGGLMGIRCFDREGILSANNAGIDL